MSYLRSARVVVTGIGIVAPTAIGKSDFWASLSRGHSGTKRITLFDASAYHAQIAGEISNFNLKNYLEPKGKISRMSRQTQFAVAAAAMAVEDASVSEVCASSTTVVPIFMGVGNAAIGRIEKSVEQFQRRGPSRASPTVVESCSPHQAASQVGYELDVLTSSHTVASACAAGIQAVAMGANTIRSGEADVVIAGGTDSPLTKYAFASFDRIGYASARNDDPQGASRPFDRDSDSGVISEGSAVFVLENLEHALARGADIYAEILGVGSHSDSADQPLSGLSYAMTLAVANSNRRPVDIDFISAHGPSHPGMDRLETEMIKLAFRDDAYKIPVTSVKGNTGNPMAAAGPMQLVSCALAFKEGVIPFIANHQVPAEGCDLDYVKTQARMTHPQIALINSHGVGGSNTSMLIQKVTA